MTSITNQKTSKKEIVYWLFILLAFGLGLFLLFGKPFFHSERRCLDNKCYGLHHVRFHYGDWELEFSLKENVDLHHQPKNQ